MKSYFVQETQPLSGLFLNGRRISSDASLRRQVQLDVVNGLVKGDRKTPNPFSYQKTDQTVEIGTRVTKGVDSSRNFYVQTREGALTTLNVTHSTPSPDFTVTDDEAMSQIYGQLRGNNNLVLDFAEWHQTRKMLKDTMRFGAYFDSFHATAKAQRAYRSIRKGPSQDQRRLDFLTAKWLEVRYGWTPLLSSIYDAMDQIKNKNFDLNVRVKGKHSVLVQKNRLSGDGSYGNPTRVATGTCSTRTKYIMYFKLDSGVQVYDWTTLNPVAIAWELMPLSFVADWFVNVSQCIENIENWWLFRNQFVKGVQIRSSLQETSVTARGVTTEPIYYYLGLPNTDQTYYRDHSGKATLRSSVHSRVILNTLPFTARPRIEVKLGAKRQLDAAALIQQLIVRKLRPLSGLTPNSIVPRNKLFNWETGRPASWVIPK
jgi:hypothetical protein